MTNTTERAGIINLGEGYQFMWSHNEAGTEIWGVVTKPNGDTIAESAGWYRTCDPANAAADANDHTRADRAERERQRRAAAALKAELYPGLIAEGCRTADDGETWTSWMLLQRNANGNVTVEGCEIDPADEAAVVCAMGWVRYYAGPGRLFTSAGRVRVSKSLVLVTQYGGLDI